MQLNISDPNIFVELSGDLSSILPETAANIAISEVAGPQDISVVFVGEQGPAGGGTNLFQQFYLVDEGQLPTLPLPGPAVCIERRNNGKLRMYFTNGEV